jgi:hypothetical protein
MRATRRRAAAQLLERWKSKGEVGVTVFTSYVEVDEVLNFFEWICALLRRKVLDEELIWHLLQCGFQLLVREPGTYQRSSSKQSYYLEGFSRASHTRNDKNARACGAAFGIANGDGDFEVLTGRS